MLSMAAAMFMASCTEDPIGNGNDPNGNDPVEVNVALDRNEMTLTIGQTAQLIASVTPEGTEVEWTSDDSSIASVDENGLVTAVAEGTATITVSAGDVSDECTVVVTPVAVESVTLDQEYLEIHVGETAVLSAVVAPDNAQYVLSWESSDEAIATVADGTVTAVAIGNATVTVTAGDKTDECLVTVVPVPVEEIQIEPASLEITVGQTASLTATVLPENATDKTVTWSSSDESIATVVDGTVTAISAGNAEIYAKSGNIQATCPVTVLYPEIGDPQVGDYYYSDGTISSNLDPSKTPIAVVFWIGDPTANDPALAQDHPNCTHGLAVAIGGEIERTTWQSKFTSYGATVNEWVEANTDYLPIQSAYDGSEPDYLNKIMGYNNTKAIEAFNADPANAGWPVEAVANAVAYRETVPAPDASSDWYLPSAKEVSLMISGEYDGNIYYISEELYARRDLVNEKIAAIEGATALDIWDYYWSSTEMDYMNIYTMYNYNGWIYSNTKEATYINIRLRFVLAF